jgi:hypothetical protein
MRQELLPLSEHLNSPVRIAQSVVLCVISQRGIEHRFHAEIVEEIWGIPMLWRFNIGMISQWNYCCLTSNKQNFRIINCI